MSDDAMNLFAEWLDRALSIASRFPVVAYNFNLYEGSMTWDMELVGSSRFDSADLDWPCDAIYTYPQFCRFSRWDVGDERGQALAFAIEMVSTYLRSGAKKEILRSSEGVGIGFVDGDLTLLWPESAA